MSDASDVLAGSRVGTEALARAIYDALRAGDPEAHIDEYEDGLERVTIDGHFNLFQVADLIRRRLLDD
jgi:hypothetical protein